MDERGLGPAYVYLLGIYLGDGMLSLVAKNVWELRLFQDARYTNLLDSWHDAMVEVAGHKVTRAQRLGCVELISHWKHWICLFPQHAAGPKYLRPIVLSEWQRFLAEHHPAQLVKGPIESDGCRAINRVRNRLGVRYEYPRYFFTNHSDDILALFVEACRMIGVECRPNNRYHLSVAKRKSVAILDEFIGPKR